MRPGIAARTAAVALVVTVAAGCSSGAPAMPAAVSAAAPPAAPSAPVAATTVLPRAEPAGLEVPSIGVRVSGLIDLGLTPTGEMEVPADAVTAGWFDLGPTPGELGPAVIAAHVNFEKVPGLFARLHETAVGDAIAVTRVDGSTATFIAYRVERFAKAAFPTEDVYGNTAGPELRLITCGGAFDRASGDYGTTSWCSPGRVSGGVVTLRRPRRPAADRLHPRARPSPDPG